MRKAKNLESISLLSKKKVKDCHASQHNKNPTTSEGKKKTRLCPAQLLAPMSLVLGNLSLTRESFASRKRLMLWRGSLYSDL